MIKMFGTVVLVLLSLSAAAHEKECEVHSTLILNPTK